MFLDLGYFAGKEILSGKEAYKFFPELVNKINYHLFEVNCKFIGAYSMEIRTPYESREAAQGFYTLDWVGKNYDDGWHQDNNGVKKEYIVLWANIWPTEIRHKKTKKLVEIEIGHAVMFDNSKYEHRPPKEAAKCNHRWFSRMFVVLKRKPTNKLKRSA